jgi:hypothetical protein
MAFALLAVGIASWTVASAGWAGTGNSGTGNASPVIVSGMLVNGARQPLAGVAVDLYSSSRLGTATTDRKGHFVLRAAARRASRSGWLKLDLFTGHSTLAAHKVLRRRFVDGRWVGPAGGTDLGVLILAAGQPSVTATVTHGGSTAGADGWVYGVVVRGPGSDPRSGNGGGATVPVAGDTVVARSAAGSASAVSAHDGSFQMLLPAGAITLTEDICGVDKQMTIERDTATRVALEIPNSC